MSNAVITAKTAKDLEVLDRFFALDLDTNRHIFRYAAQVNGAAFETVIAALADAVREDCRYGLTQRIRQRVKEKARK